MKKLYLIRLLWVAMFFGAFNANAAVRYVNGGVTISGDGNSWDSPYKTLQEAITAASSGDEIWVAAGTYQPASGQSFAMKEGVKIYGGFAGTENSLAQRNWKTNVSELMGNQASVVINDGNGLTSAALLDGFKISSGYATAGGGMYNKNASPTISNCIFASNIADEMGGAMYNLNSSPTIVNVVFDSNETELDGAAVYNKDSSPLVMNTIFFENPATRYGGAMFNSGGNVNVINCLFKGNRVWTDGDGAAIYSKSGTTIAVINSIVWGNLLEEETISTFGGDGTTNISYSIIEGGDSNNGNKNTDPKFVDVVGYKGSDGIWGTADDGLRLSANSPAINAGTNAQYLNLSAATTDVSGKPRVYDFANNGVIDMGAYEYQGVLVFPAADGTVYVKKGSTGNGTSWADAVGELAHALKTAKTVPDIKQIWVAAGTYTPLFSPADDNFGDDASRANAFLLVRNVQVYGGFAGTETNLSQRDFYANLSTLSGDLGAFGKSYNVVISSGPMGLATLDGFTIRDGDASNPSYFYVNGNQVYPCSGAGIYNSVSDAFYNNLIVMNNSSGESGGGMFSYRSSVRLSNVTMKSNSARHGGAMANQDNSHATVINSLFFANSSSEGGDAIYNVDGSLPKFINITVAQNTGGAKNGILNEQNAEPKVYNSIVWGGIDGDYQAENSIIQHSDDASNGNIDASSLDDIDIFKNPANNEFSLKSASPAINKGNNALYQTPDGVNNTSLTNDKDLEGNPRVYNLITGGTIDLGAYEYQGTLSQTISFAALDAKTTNSADFTLSATASSGLAVGYTSSNTNIAEVYQDNSVWKVKIKAAGSVDITAQQAGNGDYAAASAVVQTLVITEGVLPVQLTNYTAKVVNQTAKLDWSVSSERDNRKFVIYRSGDDNQFAEIGEVASLGNTSTNRNYFFVDKQPLNGNNYYKLMQVDLDGKPTELGVKPLNFILSAVHVSVYPNPTKEKVNVTFEAGKYNRAALSSIEGKVLKSFELSAQHDQLAIDLSAYSIGTYFIRLTGAQQSIVKKVVKQ